MGRMVGKGRDFGGRGGMLEEGRELVKLFCFKWGIWTGKLGCLERKTAGRLEENYLPVSFPSGYSGACADVTAMRAFLGGAILNLVYKIIYKDGVMLYEFWFS
jgi:hypothetical protein